MSLSADIRHDWSKSEIANLYEWPFIDLLLKAQSLLRTYFSANTIQISTLLNIKTGACPEDCGYCVQSRHYNTGLKKEPLFAMDRVLDFAKQAKANGATRFCMGAAWRRPPKQALEKISEMIAAVKALGLETCVTLGSLSRPQAEQLKCAGLDYYNHNLDTSPEYYPKVITTRTYQERLDTLENVRQANIKVCCGGILGLGESHQDRISFLHQLANLPEHPESVPINHLTPQPGTPLENMSPIDHFEFIRTVAVARILMPRAFVRLSAGRDKMSAEMQALCFMAGANSIHYGEKLLTVDNPTIATDQMLLNKLGLSTYPSATNYVNESFSAEATTQAI